MTTSTRTHLAAVGAMIVATMSGCGTATHCGPGTTDVDGVCFAAPDAGAQTECGPGTIDFSGVCLPTNGDGGVLAQCGPGTTDENGTCRPISADGGVLVECGPGTVEVDSVCVSSTGDAGSCMDGGPGCSPSPTIVLTSSTLSFQLGTVSSITLTATGTDDSQPWVDGSTPPTFSTTWGSFLNPANNHGGSDVQTDSNAVITGHTALVQLFPDSSLPIAGSFVVTASYSDNAGARVQATVTITVTVPPVASLAFSCETYNIGALADQNSDMEIKCTAQAFDASNNLVPGADIQFLAEAGSVSFDPVANTYAYFPFVSGPGNVSGSQPLDVMPSAAWNEPSYVDTSDPTMPTRNPRDGLATLVAYVSASSTGVANNGLSNPAYAGAPFVDVDDTGSFHTGDPFLDVNHNGVYAATQSTSSIVWKQVKILWAGSVQSTPPIATVTWNGAPPNNVDLPYPGSGTITWTILDQNLNIVAANNPTQDEIIWTCDPLPNVTPNAPGSTLLANGNGPRLGFDVDSNFNIIPTTTWEIGAKVSLTVQNESECTSTAMAMNFDCYGQLNRTMWLDQNGNPQDEMNSETTLTVSGSVEPQPPTCGA